MQNSGYGSIAMEKEDRVSETYYFAPGDFATCDAYARPGFALKLLNRNERLKDAD